MALCHGRQRAHGQCGLQDVPVIGVAVIVVPGFHNHFTGEGVLLGKNAVDFRLNPCKGKGIERRGKVAQQFIGVVADFTDVVAVFIIAGVIFLGIVNVNL